MAEPEPSHRLYSCARCAVQVHICRRCDRGNIYCARACAALRRRESLSRAGQRYQLSLRGACRHAARQRTWRARQAQKVTHQGSPAAAAPVTVVAACLDRPRLLDHDQTAPVAPRALPRSAPRCSFCARVLSGFARLGPLRSGP
jgi:hypothetical protein